MNNFYAGVECLHDVIDNYSCAIICDSKLRLRLWLEKNIVYKLNQEKDFKYFTKMISLCYPVKCEHRCKSARCFIKIEHIDHCQEENIVYNIAYLKFSGYLLYKDDVLLNSTTPERCPED